MPNRTPEAAVDTVLDELRLLMACVSGNPYMPTAYRPSSHPFLFAFAPFGPPVRLQTEYGRPRVLSAVELGRAIEHTLGDVRVRLLSCSSDILDHHEREIVAYHWHPIGVSSVTFPHLHLSGRLAPLALVPSSEQIALGAMHLPTGPITCADIVRLLITEFGVAPRRPDWDAVLDAHREPVTPDD